MGYFWQNPAFQPNQRTRCRVIDTLGDVNPIEYGGGFVLSCTGGGRGERTYEIEIAPDAGEEADEGSPITVYRVDVPDDVWGYYSPMSSGFTPEKLAPTIGANVRELRAAGSSQNVMDRVSALEAIAATWGWHELDSDPLQLTPAELRRRWRGMLGRKR